MLKKGNNLSVCNISGVIIDIGTGDGKFVYELAKEYPERLIIGVDPNQANLRENSTRINKKTSKGGLKNALYVLASVNDLPNDLSDTANQVFINFPWGSLLKSVVTVEKDAWENIKKVCQNGALVDIVFGYDSHIDLSEKERLTLPTLSIDYIHHKMFPLLRELGFLMVEFESLSGKNLQDFPSLWAKRLGQRLERKYYHLRFVVQK